MVYYANLNPEHISWNSIFYDALQLIRFYISYNRITVNIQRSMLEIQLT